MTIIGRPLWVGCYKDPNATGPGNCLVAEPVGLVRKRDGALIARANDVEGGTWTTARGETWYGVEGYVDPPGPSTAAEAQQALRAKVAALMAPLGGKPVVLTAQAYDRNGAWTDTTTLTALQSVYPELVNQYPNIVALLAFAKARTGGLDSHPELAEAWRAIASGVAEPELPAVATSVPLPSGVDVTYPGSTDVPCIRTTGSTKLVGFADPTTEASRKYVVRAVEGSLHVEIQTPDGRVLARSAKKRPFTVA